MRLNRARTSYVCEAAGDRAREIGATRLLLQYFGDRVQRFECDIPLSESADWPDEVRRAAEVLASRRRRRRRGETESYRTTGLVERSEQTTWEAFVTFAPYAYDATAFGTDGPLVSLADCSQSIVVEVGATEAAAANQLLRSAGLPELTIIA